MWTQRIETALVISAHTDDAELGAGATITRLAERGTAVHYLALSTGHPSRGATEAECRAALARLGVRQPERVTVWDYPTRDFDAHRQSILDFLIAAGRVAGGPHDVVFCPSSYDRHQDHVVVRAEVDRAFPRTTVLGYELPPTQGAFAPALWWTVDRRHMIAKTEALACYESQAAMPYTRGVLVWALAAVRGMQAGCRFAEAFEVVRWMA